MPKVQAIHGFSLLKAAWTRDPPSPELDPSVVKAGWALKVLEQWLKDPKLQAHWKWKAAMVNARNGIIPSILRQTTGTQAWKAPRNLCPSSPQCAAWVQQMVIWKRMSKEERAEWYSKEKEPLLQAKIVVEQEKLHLVSKNFNALQGVLEIIASHMVGWDDQVEAARLRKNAMARARKAERDAERDARNWAEWRGEEPRIPGKR